jgi:hypothetical protein
VRGLVGTKEIAGASVRLLAAALALPEQERAVLGDMQGQEPVLEDKPAAVLDGVRVGRRRVHGGFVEGNHEQLRDPGREWRDSSARL